MHFGIWNVILILPFLFIALTFFPLLIILILYGGKHEEQQKEKNDFFVTVIIPVFNEEDFIDKKIQNLLAIDYPRDKTEIIVIDDGSTDRTTVKLRKYKKSGLIRVIFEEHKGKTHAINRGVDLSKGEIIFITDADTILAEDALKKIMSRFSDKKVGLVFGGVIFRNPKKEFTAVGEFRYRLGYDRLQVAESNFDSSIIVNGGICAFRKELYIPYNSALVAEDTEFGISVRKRGFKVVYDEDVICYHDFPGSLFTSYKQKRRRAYGIIEAILRNKDTLFNKKYGRYGLVLMPLMLLMFTVCPFAFGFITFSLAFFFVGYLFSLLTSSLMYLILPLSLIISLSILRYKNVRGLIISFFYFLILQVAMIHANLSYLLRCKIDWS